MSGNQRINEILQQYWDKVRGQRKYPKEQDLSIAELAPIWDSCFLVKVKDADTVEDTEFSYIYLGSRLVEAYGDDSQERDICEHLVYPSSMSLLHKFREVLDIEGPVVEEGEFVNARNMLVKYRSNMLPLAGSDGDDKIRYIIGGMKWKAF